MNLIQSTPLNGVAAGYNSSGKVLTVSQVAIESISYSTIDGDFIDYNDGSEAINTGSGIFIGDYFVGNSTYLQTNNAPFLKY